MENINSFQLKNDLVVLSEHLPHIQSVLLGIWVKQGSRSENTDLFGMAHYLEHMLFKGTKNRSALEIAQSLESVGGDLNGFTSREHCCFYAKATVEHASLVFDVISDLIFHPVFDAQEMEREKLVVCQEIDMYEDSPEELAHELLVEIMYGPWLGHPVIGAKQNVMSFTKKQLTDFYTRFYHPKNMFLTIVGNFDSFGLEENANRYFNENAKRCKLLSPIADEKKFSVATVFKEIEQAHTILGWHALNITHTERYTLHLLSTWMGGGMSSILFQEIREKLGLAYNIYSFVRAYKDHGFFGIYLASTKTSISQALSKIRKVIDKLCENGLSEEELDKLKSQLKGSLLLGLEKTSFRMNRIGIGHLYFERTLKAEELIQMVNQVTNADIKKLAIEIFSQTPSCVSVGSQTREEFECALKSYGN